jgi:hypothetical protein
MLCRSNLSVMAGLVPAIHAAPYPADPKRSGGLTTSPNALAFGRDDRDKLGHDGVGFLS